MYRLIYFVVFILHFVVSLYSNPYETHKLRGRIIFDSGSYLSGIDSVGFGTSFTDIRIGLKGNFDKNWFYKLDIAYTGDDVTAKDVFFGYKNSKHEFRLGHFYEPFSIDMMVSTVDMRFKQPAGIVYTLGNSRRLGFCYVYDVLNLNYTFALMSDNGADNAKKFSKGYSLHSRFIYRPISFENELLHIGASYSWFKLDNEKYIYNCGNAIVDPRPLVELNIMNVRTQNRAGVELYYHNRKVAFQSEYVISSISRKNMSSYFSNGGYAEVAYILWGNPFVYDTSWATIVRPNGKSLELTARYNYQNMNDSKAQIYGGSLHDFTIGLNWYITYNFALKCDYNYLIPISNVTYLKDRNLSMLQVRAQMVF